MAPQRLDRFILHGNASFSFISSIFLNSTVSRYGSSPISNSRTSFANGNRALALISRVGLFIAHGGAIPFYSRHSLSPPACLNLVYFALVPSEPPRPIGPTRSTKAAGLGTDCLVSIMLRERRSCYGVKRLNSNNRNMHLPGTCAFLASTCGTDQARGLPGLLTTRHKRKRAGRFIRTPFFVVCLDDEPVFR
jgi:hypothetical protein